MECYLFQLFFFNFLSILYELVSEQEAFIKFKYYNSSFIYNHIRAKNFEFFIENERTGKKDLDDFIVSCTHREANLRPNAAEALK